MNRKELLEKYWNAETSLEEERQLKDMLSDAQAPESAYFKMLEEARAQQSKLHPSDAMSHVPAEEEQARRGARIRPLYRIVASAAAVLILAIAGYGLWQYSRTQAQENLMAETYDDPHEAYEEIRETLAFVSAKLNQSQNEAFTQIQKAGEYAELFK